MPLLRSPLSSRQFPEVRASGPCLVRYSSFQTAPRCLAASSPMPFGTAFRRALPRVRASRPPRPSPSFSHQVGHRPGCLLVGPEGHRHAAVLDQYRLRLERPSVFVFRLQAGQSHAHLLLSSTVFYCPGSRACCLFLVPVSEVREVPNPECLQVSAHGVSASWFPGSRRPSRRAALTS